jgi:FSR family fosmidomycin resistance protein-like MFS transporter
MMAIFALSGYLGQSAGPFCSGSIESTFGLPSLAWGAVVGVLLLVFLATARGSLPTPGRTDPRSSGAVAAGPRWLWALVLAIGAMRILPAMGVPLIVTYWLEDSAAIGLTQSAFMGGIGSGSIVCALAVGPRHERMILCALPIAAAPFIAALPMLEGPLRIVVTGLAGFLLGIAMPVFISYGQQLFPHRPRAASSVTMGVSWGVAGGLAAVTVWAFGDRSSLGQAFWVIAAGSVLAGAMSLFLPRVKSV